MIKFIDEYEAQYGVESMCAHLPIAPSTYYRHKYLQQYPDRRSRRVRHDEQFCRHIYRVWTESYGIYGRRKVWQQLKRERIRIAKCTVERLMQKLGIEGVSRGNGKPPRQVPAEKNPLPDLVLVPISCG